MLLLRFLLEVVHLALGACLPVYPNFAESVLIELISPFHLLLKLGLGGEQLLSELIAFGSEVGILPWSRPKQRVRIRKLGLFLSSLV